MKRMIAAIIILQMIVGCLPPKKVCLSCKGENNAIDCFKRQYPFSKIIAIDTICKEAKIYVFYYQPTDSIRQ